MSQCADDSPSSEEGQGKQDHRSAPEDVREGREARLKDRRGEEEGSPGPEGFDGGPIQFLGYDLWLTLVSDPFRE